MTSVTSEQLDTFISLFFSPFVALASTTSAIVGMWAFAALVAGSGTAGVPDRIGEAMGYGTAVAFAVSLPPAVFLVYSTITVYT